MIIYIGWYGGGRIVVELGWKTGLGLRRGRMVVEVEWYGVVGLW